jgi:hypothetical protein
MLYHQTVDQLRALRLEGMVQALEEQRRQPDILSLDFEERLALLVQRQWLWRENRGLATRLQTAQFKINACLEDLDYRPSRGLKRAQIEQLRASRWVQEHRNCLLTGSTGSGKTYLACALGQQACRDGHRTLYFYAPKFFRALESARADGSLLPWLKKLTHEPLLIVDDLGIGSVPGKLYREFLECSMIVRVRVPPSSPASSPSRNGTKSSPTPPWPMPFWIGWSTTPTGSSSKVNRSAKAKRRLRKMPLKVPTPAARLCGRAGESVARSDRRKRELRFVSPFPPLTARPHRRREDRAGGLPTRRPTAGLRTRPENRVKTWAKP